MALISVLTRVVVLETMRIHSVNSNKEGQSPKRLRLDFFFWGGGGGGTLVLFFLLTSITICFINVTQLQNISVYQSTQLCEYSQNKVDRPGSEFMKQETRDKATAVS